MANKNKGTNAEREIIHLFWKMPNWVACRVAGSGSMKYPSPDIIAGNSYRKLAIECKTTKDNSQYLTKEEVKNLLEFCKKFEAEPWIAVKFSRREWKFFKIDELKETGKHYVVDVEEFEKKGVKFEIVAGY